MRNAIQLAVDEVNARGGLQQRRVRLAEFDDGSQPATGVAAATRLAADLGIVAALGEYDQSAADAEETALGSGKVPFVNAGWSTREASVLGRNPAGARPSKSR